MQESVIRILIRSTACIMNGKSPRVTMTIDVTTIPCAPHTQRTTRPCVLVNCVFYCMHAVGCKMFGSTMAVYGSIELVSDCVTKAPCDYETAIIACKSFVLCHACVQKQNKNGCLYRLPSKHVCSFVICFDFTWKACDTMHQTSHSLSALVSYRSSSKVHTVFYGANK